MSLRDAMSHSKNYFWKKKWNVNENYSILFQSVYDAINFLQFVFIYLCLKQYNVFTVDLNIFISRIIIKTFKFKNNVCV